MSERLRQLMHSQLVVMRALQDELDKLVPPTTTGYMHSKESWTITRVGAPDDYSKVELTLDLEPPDAAYEWHRPTAEGLQTLKTQLGCDYLYAYPRSSGKIRYIARFNKPEGSPSP